METNVEGGGRERERKVGAVGTIFDAREVSDLQCKAGNLMVAIDKGKTKTWSLRNPMDGEEKNLESREENSAPPPL